MTDRPAMSSAFPSFRLSTHVNIGRRYDSGERGVEPGGAGAEATTSPGSRQCRRAPSFGAPAATSWPAARSRAVVCTRRSRPPWVSTARHGGVEHKMFSGRAVRGSSRRTPRARRSVAPSWWYRRSRLVQRKLARAPSRHTAMRRRPGPGRMNRNTGCVRPRPPRACVAPRRPARRSPCPPRRRGLEGTQPAAAHASATVPAPACARHARH